MEKDYYYHLKKAEAYYFSIGSVECPNLSMQVYFTRKGFRHFLRKKTGLRTLEEQIRRFNLLHYVLDIISSRQSIIQYEQGIKFRFCAIMKEVEKNYFVKVLTIETHNGELHFFSVMDFYKQK